MRTIWKFDLSWGEVTRLVVPAHASIVHVDIQHFVPQAWVLLDPDQPERLVMQVSIMPTGADIPGHLGEYVKTFFSNQDSLVWHVFALRDRRLTQAPLGVVEAGDGHR